MPDEELKKLIKEQKIKPSELYSRLELRDDPIVKREIDLAVEFEKHWKDIQLNEEMEKEIEEEERKQIEEEERKKEQLEQENELIPSDDIDEKKEKDTNELIPDDSEESKDLGDDELDDLIPD